MKYFKKDNTLPDLSKSTYNFKEKFIEGYVYRKDKSYTYVDLGLKVNPRLSNRYLRNIFEKENLPLAKVGQSISMFIEEIENAKGEYSLRVMTSKRYTFFCIWNTLRKHYATEEPIVGRLLNSHKGGFCVGFGGFTAFLPSSHLMRGRAPTYNLFLERARPLMGNLLYFKVLNLNPSTFNVVVSRTSVMSPEGTLIRPSRVQNDATESYNSGI